MDQSKYLPAIHSSVVTAYYCSELLQKMLQLRIKNSQNRINAKIRNQRVKFYTRFRRNQIAKLGFGDGNHPDKTWVFNILKTIDPNHSLFKNPQVHDQSNLTQDDLIQQLFKNISEERRSELRIQRRCSQVKPARKELIQAKNLLQLSQLTEGLQQINQGIQQEVQQAQSFQRRN